MDILQKPFVDYSTSRNRVMDWVSADPDIDFYIFFDANDELQVRGHACLCGHSSRGSIRWCVL